MCHPFKKLIGALSAFSSSSSTPSAGGIVFRKRALPKSCPELDNSTLYDIIQKMLFSIRCVQYVRVSVNLINIMYYIYIKLQFTKKKQYAYLLKHVV